MRNKFAREFYIPKKASDGSHLRIRLQTELQALAFRIPKWWELLAPGMAGARWLPEPHHVAQTVITNAEWVRRC